MRSNDWLKNFNNQTIQRRKVLIAEKGKTEAEEKKRGVSNVDKNVNVFIGIIEH